MKTFMPANADQDFQFPPQVPRREADNCISVIDGKAYPVHNWSDGGMLVHADDRMFSLSAPVEVTMKFRLSGRIMDIAHRGRVSSSNPRPSRHSIRALSRDVSNKFKQVIDGSVTREFAESSQLA